MIPARLNFLQGRWDNNTIVLFLIILFNRRLKQSYDKNSMYMDNSAVLL